MFVYYWSHVDSCFSFKKGEDEDRFNMLSDDILLSILARVNVVVCKPTVGWLSTPA